MPQTGYHKRGYHQENLVYTALQMELSVIHKLSISKNIHLHEIFKDLSKWVLGNFDLDTNYFL